ncbi:MAG: hypothetical protein ACOYJ2_05060 [Rickettsiales bacterium]
MSKRPRKDHTETLRKRERLEVIVDSCCAGEKVLHGVDILLDQIEVKTKKPLHIFKNYQLVIPIQISTETRRLLFPEIFDAEMRYRATSGERMGGLEALVQKYSIGDEHIEEPKDRRVRAVENEISRAYKLFYLNMAHGLLREDKGVSERVAESAAALMQRYGFDSKKNAHKDLVTAKDVRKVCHEAGKKFNQYLREFAHIEREIVETHESLIEAHCESVGIPREMLVKSAVKAYDEALEAKLETARMQAMADCAKELFDSDDFGDKERCIVQALYNNDVLRDVPVDPTFKSFSGNLGERAIDRFLMEKRSKPKENRVTLVVTRDKGALNSIEQIRNGDPRHTIICLNPYGLALALKERGLIDDLHEVADADAITYAETSPRKRPVGKAPNLNSPANQQKWATRLNEVLEYGDYAEHGQEISDHRSRKNGGRQ